MRKRIFIAVFLVFSSALFSAVSAQEAGRKTHVAEMDESGVQKVEVTGGEYYFDPNYIIVKVGVPVEISVKKPGGFITHNIVIEAPGAGMDIREDFGKEPKAVRFTPTKTGKYPFFCDKKFLFFKNHKEKGMEGTIEVIE